MICLILMDMVDGCSESGGGGLSEAGNGCARWLHAAWLEGRSSLKGPFNCRANDELEAVPNLNPLEIVISLTAMILESQITRQSLELSLFCPYSRNDLRENYILRLWWFCITP